MKYIPFIVAVWALFAMTACTVDDMKSSSGEYPMNGDVVTVMGRITRFKDYDVSNRAAKQGDEGKITSMALAIFPVSETNGVASLDAGGCVYYNYSADGSELLFTIDRSSDDTHFEQDKRYAMYVFANIPGMASFAVGSSLDEMLKVTTEVGSLDIPTNGFPMIGSLGDTFSTTFEKDGQTFILSPTENGELVAPKVDGQSQNLLTIPMKAMYAKVNFTITVRPDQTIEGNYSPEFTLTDYKVCDVPNSVDCDNSTSGSSVIESLDGLSISGNLSASGANSIKFSFYLPEQLLQPATSSADYEYPFGKGSELRKEDEVYRQRHKAKLLGESQKATHIVISGRYRDHQNHYYDVDYTIYLGKDNYEDFNVERNCEYSNYITIRGILSSADASSNQDAVSIDHRVNVERTQPAIISLRREVLLDSHFEVRPLRVRASGIDGIDNINAVKVEVVEPGTTDWMRIERSFGDGTEADSPVNGNNESIYITDEGASKGKRRYFTYNLVNGLSTDGTTLDTSGNSLVNSTAVIVPLADGGDCVWIYVDECLETGDDVRSGMVKVTYGNGTTTDNFVATNNEAFPPVEYTINQRKLFEVTYEDRTYHIEYEEEYLHNFDADAEYGQTEYEGMQWGLPNTQLSYDKEAILIHNSGIEQLTNPIKEAVRYYSPFYDFYLTRDVDRDIYYFADETEYAKLVHNHNGYGFCNDIIQEVNGANGNNNDNSDNIDILPLNGEIKSAIEYCYNKNKRNLEGHVVWLNVGTYNYSQLNWYLPAIDEVEEIVMSKYNTTENTYSRFYDFQNKFYWSSQPAFYQNIFLVDRTWITPGDRMGHYMIDNPDFARATKVAVKNGQYVSEYSGMEDGTYYNYIYFKAGGNFMNTNITGQTLYEVVELVKNNGDIAGGTADGTYFQFKWDNNDVDEITEKVYPPAYEDGYLHRMNDMARVRCVRVQSDKKTQYLNNLNNAN